MLRVDVGATEVDPLVVLRVDLRKSLGCFFIFKLLWGIDVALGLRHLIYCLGAAGWSSEPIMLTRSIL
jgi:hypothetical protein